MLNIDEQTTLAEGVNGWRAAMDFNDPAVTTPFYFYLDNGRLCSSERIRFSARGITFQPLGGDAIDFSDCLDNIN